VPDPIKTPLVVKKTQPEKMTVVPSERVSFTDGPISDTAWRTERAVVVAELRSHGLHRFLSPS
jgi:hypothetical protein